MGRRVCCAMKVYGSVWKLWRFYYETQNTETHVATTLGRGTKNCSRKMRFWVAGRSFLNAAARASERCRCELWPTTVAVFLRPRTNTWILGATIITLIPLSIHTVA